MLCIMSRKAPCLRKLTHSDRISEPIQELEPIPDSPSFIDNRQSMDCNRCMMIEMGEMTAYPGQPCESCGRMASNPYGECFKD